MATNGNLEKTMLLPLWGRAWASRQYPEILVDRQAIQVAKKLGYSFSTAELGFGAFGAMSHLVRARSMDDGVRAYVARHPGAAVVNMGAGLDTSFPRVDNGTLRWFDLDLPGALAFRNTVIPKAQRTAQLATSVFQTGWFGQIAFQPREGAVFFAAGLFYFFREQHIRPLLAAMAEAFPGAELLFDANSSEGLAKCNAMMQKTGNTKALMYFSVDDARALEGWSPHIRLKQARPRFEGVPRLPQMSAEMVAGMDDSDAHRRILHIHLEFV